MFKKPWVKIVLGLVAVGFLAVLMAPLFVNADAFRPMNQGGCSLV